MKNTNIKQTALSKKANKHLVVGTALKVLLPGTGIGSLVTTAAWVEALVDCYFHPENYKDSIDTESYRWLAGVESKVVADHKKATAEDIKKFTDEIQSRIDELGKKDEGESQ